MAPGVGVTVPEIDLFTVKVWKKVGVPAGSTNWSVSEDGEVVGENVGLPALKTPWVIPSAAEFVPLFRGAARLNFPMPTVNMTRTRKIRMTTIPNSLGV
jgi:hypothetical protein